MNDQAIIEKTLIMIELLRIEQKKLDVLAGELSSMKLYDEESFLDESILKIRKTISRLKNKLYEIDEKNYPKYVNL